MTILAALCSGVLVGFVITVVIHDRFNERRGPDRVRGPAPCGTGGGGHADGSAGRSEH